MSTAREYPPPDTLRSCEHARLSFSSRSRSPSGRPVYPIRSRASRQLASRLPPSSIARHRSVTREPSRSRTRSFTARAIGAGVMVTGDAKIPAQIRSGLLAFGWRRDRRCSRRASGRRRAHRRARGEHRCRLQRLVERLGWWPGRGQRGPDWAWAIRECRNLHLSSGTLIITMLDVAHGNTNAKRVPLLWAAGVDGVLTQSSLDGALKGIDQAFTQSPYLERP